MLSQLGDLSGYSSEYGNNVVKVVDLLLPLNQGHAQALFVGLLAVILVVVLDRTRLRNSSMLLGMVFASAAVVVLCCEAVDQVGDVAQGPGGLPLPALPDLAGVSPRVKEQLDVTENTGDVLGDEDIFLATEDLGEATRLALEGAQAWLEREADEPSAAM